MPPAGEGRVWVQGHKGQAYKQILSEIHSVLRPRTYVELGVFNGNTLALAECASIGVDPNFMIDRNVMGKKPSLTLRQVGSDEFFSDFDPNLYFKKDHVDLFFLDGMHLFEFLLRDFANAERFSRPNSVIAMHDCLPVDLHMTARVNEPSPHPCVYEKWWTGDVWRILPVLKKFRPELRIHCLDAPPTGLVLVTGLDPTSTTLSDRYGEIVAYGLGLDLAEIGIRDFFESLPIASTKDYVGLSNLARHFWL